MKGIILGIILTVSFSLTGFSEPIQEEPEYYKGANYPVDEETGSSERCRDICQEIDENGTCIKVEVRCSD